MRGGDWLGWLQRFGPGTGTEGHLDLPLFVGGAKHGDCMAVPYYQHYTLREVRQQAAGMYWTGEVPPAGPIEVETVIYRRQSHRPCFDAELLTFHVEARTDLEDGVAMMQEFIA